MCQKSQPPIESRVYLNQSRRVERGGATATLFIRKRMQNTVGYVCRRAANNNMQASAYSEPLISDSCSQSKLSSTDKGTRLSRS